MDKDIHEDMDLSVFSNKEKVELKRRIFRSIRHIERRKRLRYTFGTAAAVLLLIGLGANFILHNQKPTIADFVSSSENAHNIISDKITLVIDKGEDVVLEGTNTSITYSKNGDQIVLDDSKVLKQKTHDSNNNKKVKYNTLIVPYGKHSTITLSDGTTANLNAGSKLIYPAVFDSDRREVYLIGEANFDVAHDAKHPFIVLTKSQEIEVLGTVFNVSSYPSDANHFVVLKSGSVKLASTLQKDKSYFGSNKNEIVITPGTKANLNLKTLEVTESQVDVDIYFAWMDGVLILKNNNIEDIIKKLSRYYNVTISLDNKSLKNETFSGHLDLKENIENVLEVLKESTSLNYEIIKANEITIH